MTTPDAPAEPRWSIDKARALLRAAVVRVRALELVPRATVYPSFARIRPRGVLGWASAALLVVVFAIYAYVWVTRQKEFLFKTGFENDDVRTALFGYHRYEPDHALANDPIAKEMMQYTMPGIGLLYRVLIPITGIFVAPKAVQAIAIALVIWAGVILARSRQGGLAAAALLVFLVLRQGFVVNRIAGGFGRAFTFPCYAIWLAGALTRNTRARWAAILIGAVTQNYTLAILLGAEGIDSVATVLNKHRGLIFHRLKRYAVVLVTASILIGGYLVSIRGMGTVQTMDQVEETQGFRARHRGEYPILDPAPHFAKGILDPFNAGGDPLPAAATDLLADYKKYQTTGPLVVVALLLVLGATRLAPRARTAAAFLASSVLLYALARYFAYKLYAPERYYAFGAPMVGVALGVSTLGLLVPRLRRHRSAVRNLAAATFMVGLTVLAGDGIVAKNGMTIERDKRKDLYDFVSTLPQGSRLACHPWDGDDIPWWSARATTGGYETAQMWLVEGAARVEKRTDAVLAALYATDRQAVLQYAKEWRISHFLLHPDRYRTDIVKKAGFIEPMTSYAQKLVAGKTTDDFVLASPPESAIIWQNKSAVIVDVKRLAEAWQRE